MLVNINKHAFEAESSQFDPFWKDAEAGSWEPQLLRMIDLLVKPEDTVLDLGSWIGAISLYCASIGANVLSVDADPEAYGYLLKNVSKNPLLEKNINCFNLALAPEDGTAVIHARKTYGYSSSSTLIRARDTLHTKKVKGISLRTFILQQQLQKIDFIKMDIEGGEFHLLSSIQSQLRDLNYPTLYISFHLGYLSEHLHLQKLRISQLAKALVKAEELTGWSSLKKEKEKIILSCLNALAEYRHIYSETGQAIKIEDLLSKPLSIKNHSFLFSRQSLKNSSQQSDSF